ncbi:hypothetical protein ACHAXA_002216 [Cyclostephanos tholiformis]|uniref:Uncharacterized protein n=1 Tax=Cyclostephanos tholiformis TaxID=382380 RepID=A0ABD3RX17_9STRA
MIASSILSTLLLLMALSIRPVSVLAQFGIKRGPTVPRNGDEIAMTRGDELSPNDADDGGNDGRGLNEEGRGYLSEKDAADMSAIIEEATRDLETMAMITRMRKENSETLSELRKLSTTEILGGMKQALDNMKLVEILFEDKERAVREMEREGMIDKAHIQKYKKDPSLLEMDTRRGLYFQFISLAVVGGFIE